VLDQKYIKQLISQKQNPPFTANYWELPPLLEWWNMNNSRHPPAKSTSYSKHDKPVAPRIFHAISIEKISPYDEKLNSRPRGNCFGISSREKRSGREGSKLECTQIGTYSSSQSGNLSTKNSINRWRLSIAIDYTIILLPI